MTYEDALKALQERAKELSAELAKAEEAQKEKEQAVDLAEVRAATGRSIVDIKEDISKVLEVAQNLQELVKQDKEERNPEKHELPAKLDETIKDLKEAIAPEARETHTGTQVSEQPPMHVNMPIDMISLELNILIGVLTVAAIVKDAVTQIGEKAERNQAWIDTRNQSPPPVGERSKEEVEILPNDMLRKDPPMGEPSREANDTLRRDPPMGEPSKEANDVSRRDPSVDNRETALAHAAVTQTLQDAKVAPSTEELQKVTDLKEKQDRETKALEKQIDTLEKKFEEKHANNPNKEKLHEEFEKQTDLLRDALERKQEKEAREELQKTQLQEPTRAVW